MNFGERISALRRQSGLTQDKLAEQLFVSRELVSKWENCTRRPDYPTVLKLAEIFGTEPDAIIGKEKMLFAELEPMLPDGLSVSEAELTEILNRFLRSVCPADAGLFLARYYYLKKISEIAAEQHMKENLLRSRLSRTGKKLRQFIKEQYHEK